MDHARGSPIAIVGSSYRLPCADGIDPFWRVLDEGRDCVREIPADRWNAAAHYDADPSALGKSNSRWGGFVEGMGTFDAALFRMSRIEALSTDPQHRLLLEAVWMALEDAALDPTDIGIPRTTVVTAIGANEHLPLCFPDRSTYNSYATVGNIASLAANRVSHFFDLQGPSFAVDTGCSSALVALHLACESLNARDADLAIVGAANALLRPDANIAASKAWALSSNGRCHFLDPRGDGYVRSEGGGAFVLARLDDAKARGQRILGIVRGSAVNHDGRATALTAPSRDAITAVIRRAIERARIDPHDVGYVEAHGVGSPTTDVAELEAIVAALEPASRRSPLPVGSVKGNLGHLEPASGIAALGKVLLAMERGHIPRQLHHETPREGMDLDALGIRVPSSPLDWPRSTVSRIAIVNGFGLGGTNACAVIEEPPLEEAPAREEVAPFALVLTARTVASLRALASSWAEAIASQPRTLSSLLAIAERSRGKLGHRLRIVGKDASEIVARLRVFADGGDVPNDVAFAPSRAASIIANGVHAPSYPFDRRSLGTLPPNRKSELAALFGSRIRTPVAARQVVASVRRGDPALADLVSSAGIVSPGLHLWRAMRVAEEARCYALRDLELIEPLGLGDDESEIEVALVADERSFSVTSPVGNDFRSHARGTLVESDAELPRAPVALEPVGSDTRAVEGLFAAFTGDPPPARRWVVAAAVRRGAVDVSVARPLAFAGEEPLDPALVDALLHTGLLTCSADRASFGAVTLRGLRWSKRIGDARAIRARMRDATLADVFVVDAEGRTVATIEGLSVAANVERQRVPERSESEAPIVRAKRSTNDVRRIVEGALRDLLGLDASAAIPPRAGFTELGLTSLAMVELRRVLCNALEITLPATIAFDRPNLDTLVAYLVDRVAATSPAGERSKAPVAAPDSSLDAVLEDLDGLSDGEADALLEAYDTDLGQRRPT